MTTTVYSMFKDTVSRHGDRVAARHKIAGAWTDVSWSALNDRIQIASAGLVSLGLSAQSRVSIISNTRLDWVIADFGILGAGCTTVPVYQSSTSDDIQYILNDAEVKCVFVEDQAQVSKLTTIKDQLPQVKKVICFEDVDTSDEWVIGWSDFIKAGTAHWAAHQADVEARMSDVQPDDLLTLVYTSGTTGRPKGVMITHDNMVYEAMSVEETGIIRPQDVQLLFLPLAHIFAKVLEVTWVKLAHVMAFAESIAEVVPNMAEV